MEWPHFAGKAVLKVWAKQAVQLSDENKRQRVRQGKLGALKDKDEEGREGESKAGDQNCQVTLKSSMLILGLEL